MTVWTLQLAAALAGAPAPAGHEPCVATDDGWIAARLQGDRRFAAVLAAATTHRLQLVITEVVRAEDGTSTLTTHAYRGGRVLLPGERDQDARGDAGEIIGAQQVIDAACSADLVAAIDRWCLGKCLPVIEERKRAGRPVRLLVNQSVESALDPERVPWLRQSLETRRLAPDSLALELRLGDVMTRMREALAFFEAVRKIGVRVAIDDYDGGLTALQLLSVISADYLKLSDKYTLGNAISAQVDELRTLVRAAHDGGRHVIAPKVETAQSAASLWTMGVDLIQGNFVQQPGSELGFDFSASAL